MSDDAHPDLVALGKTGSRPGTRTDLDRILALYADDAEMTSDGIVRLGFAVQGSVRGKQNLRAYWSKALAMLPDLHFTPTGSSPVRTAWWCTTPTIVGKRSASTCVSARLARTQAHRAGLSQ